uniref:Uncharacterized protein n=1 Tax=Cyprinus carpio TaxID=7962 RepID=A0A8C2J4R0_CYPCA
MYAKGKGAVVPSDSQQKPARSLMPARYMKDCTMQMQMESLWKVWINA